jgi:hypothetical protein
MLYRQSSDSDCPDLPLVVSLTPNKKVRIRRGTRHFEFTGRHTLTSYCREKKIENIALYLEEVNKGDFKGRGECNVTESLE